MSEKTRYIAFGQEIKRCRDKENITQEALAEELDMTVQYLRTIENKGFLPGGRRLVYLADKFKISLDTYLDIKPSNFNAKQKSLCGRIGDCSDSEIDAVNELLNTLESYKKKAD